MKAITTRQDAINFIHGCILWIGPGFHPDYPMSDYDVVDTGLPTFSKGEAKMNQSKLDRCHKLLGDDVYEVGMEFMARMGYVPAPDENGEKQPTAVDGYSGPFLSGLEAEFHDFCKKDPQMVEEFAAHMLQNGKQFLGFGEKEVDWNVEAEMLNEVREKAIAWLQQAIPNGQRIQIAYPVKNFDWADNCNGMIGAGNSVTKVFKGLWDFSTPQVVDLCASVQKAIAERGAPDGPDYGKDFKDETHPDTYIGAPDTDQVYERHAQEQAGERP